MSSPGPAPAADTDEASSNEAGGPDPDRRASFTEAWGSALVARRAQLTFPWRGVQGSFVIGGAVIAVATLIVLAFTVPKIFSGMGFGETSAPQAVSASASPAPGDQPAVETPADSEPGAKPGSGPVKGSGPGEQTVSGSGLSLAAPAPGAAGPARRDTASSGSPSKARPQRPPPGRRNRPTTPRRTAPARPRNRPPQHSRRPRESC